MLAFKPIAVRLGQTPIMRHDGHQIIMHATRLKGELNAHLCSIESEHTERRRAVEAEHNEHPRAIEAERNEHPCVPAADGTKQAVAAILCIMAAMAIEYR